MRVAIIKVLQVRTTLKSAIEYICNPVKTNGGIMVSCNCAAPQFPADIAKAFTWTVQRAERARRSGGGPHQPVLAHHIIQSFKPGEVDPNTAHDIGVALIEQITGSHHDYVVATHQDRSHIHNHIMFNPVNTDTLVRYRMWKRRMFEYRAISDALCSARGLSTITEPQRGSLPISEIYARSKGTSTTAVLATKIDIAVSENSSWQAMVAALKEMQVEVRARGNNVLFQDATMKRAVRGRRLGPAYTEAALMARLGRENVAEFVIQPSLITPVDQDRSHIRLPGRKPPTFMTIFNDQLNSHGKTARLFLPETSYITLTNKRGEFAGQITATELYQWFTIPDPLRNVVATMPGIDLERGLTARQKGYYRWIDKKVSELHEEAATLNLLTEYRALNPEQQATFRQSLALSIATTREHLATLILDRQHRLDHGHPTDDLDRDITSTAHKINQLENVHHDINPTERKQSR